MLPVQIDTRDAEYGVVSNGIGGKDHDDEPGDV
jgi:hypothetical protein